LVSEVWEEEAVVVVTSALSGVTQELIRMVSEVAPPCGPNAEEGWAGGGEHPTQDAVTLLQERHLELWRGVTGGVSGRPSGLEDAATERKVRQILEELRILRWVARAHGSWTPASKDRALGVGERLSALLLAGALRARGVPARAFEAEKIIRTDSAFGSARVAYEETQRLARESLAGAVRTEIQIVPGFTGGDGEGRTTTLGRGTSDLTATLLASALSASLVEIWTDVDGIHTEDPRLNPTTPLVPRLGYGDARAMAKGGAKVLHPDSLDPIEGPAIPLRVRNTFNPRGAGTLVAPHPSTTGGKGPSGITYSGKRPVHIFLAGATGGVGSALLTQLRALAPRLEREGSEIRVSYLASSRWSLSFSQGLPLAELPTPLEAGGEASAEDEVAELPGGAPVVGPPDWTRVLLGLAENPPANPVFLDCTASQEVASYYQALLEAGVPVVTPNKVAFSGALSTYQALDGLAREGGVPLRYETTVGAALPVVRSIRELYETGDRVRRVEGVLSGTLSFVFNRLREGAPFSQAVREARDKGFTEPHPGEDLSGADVARKLLILCREAGFHLEPADIQVESLVPEALSGQGDPELFLEGLKAYDQDWRDRLDEAGDRPLTYLARYGGEGGAVGCCALDPYHPLAGLRATENRVVLQTDRYPDVPLTISGPGAGWEVTASGVVADLLEVIRRGGRRRRVA
jgi:aspartokinase/homoserine dehydrogenase 1